MASSSEQLPKLSSQSFHQCSSLISIKLTDTIYLLWESQVLLFIKSRGLEYHIDDVSVPLGTNSKDGKDVANPEIF
ncbi:hypothetical protein AB3S75_000408 [Citrus x aurantiifolia]